MSVFGIEIETNVVEAISDFLCLFLGPVGFDALRDWHSMQVLAQAYGENGFAS